MAVSSSPRAILSLPSDEEILVTREFDAPRHLVFEAWTTPKLVERWWHANRGRVTLVEIDLRVGGKWRYVMVADDGMGVGFHGEYLEIVPGERLVTSEVYEGLPDGVSDEMGGTTNTLTLTETGSGGTLATLLIRATSEESRDAIIASGMELGLQDALDLLEATAQSLG